jgi:hypothetical protein
MQKVGINYTSRRQKFGGKGSVSVEKIELRILKGEELTSEMNNSFNRDLMFDVFGTFEFKRKGNNIFQL